MNVLAFFLLVCALASSARADSIRIATYNLNWGNRNGEQILEAINTAAPDLICFQETTASSERFLRSRLAKTYPHFHSVGHDGRYAAERFAFASKVALSDVTFVPPEAGLFGFYSAKLTLAGAEVQIVNVHLTPVRMRPGAGLGEVMAALSATEDLHAQEIEAIVRSIDPKSPTFIVGDFNSLSAFVAPQRLAEQGMIDAFASVHENADAHTTWKWPTQTIPLELRIDYIFHTDHFTTETAETVRRDGSDHSLVVATLELSESSAAKGSP